MKLYIEQKKMGGIKLLSHKILLLVILVIVGSFSACASHKDDGYYDRANKASEKAFVKVRQRVNSLSVEFIIT